MSIAGDFLDTKKKVICGKRVLFISTISPPSCLLPFFGHFKAKQQSPGGIYCWSEV